MLLKKSIWVILSLFISACASAPEANPGTMAQTATISPSLEPTELPSSTPLPSITPTLSPSPSPTLPLPTASPAPLERITFTQSKDNLFISFANSDGTGLESPMLFEPFYNSYGPSGMYLAWSPDGRYLAFDGADKNLPCDLPQDGGCFTTNYGTFIADYAQNAIIQHVENSQANASWSPDSQHQVLSIEKESTSSSQFGDLVILDVKSGQVRPLTGGRANDLYPSWSPDGEWIAFVRFDPDIPGCSGFPQIYGNEQCHLGSLYRIRPDGSDLQLLFEPIFINNYFHGYGHDAPAWSPDSQWLAFLTRNEIEDEYPDISILNVETGELELVAGDNGPEGSPAWSPDGEQLAYSGRREEKAGIFLWDLKEKTFTYLTGGSNPVWSWSGAYIAFFSGGNVWIMNADGANKVLIGDGSLFSKPAWQPGVQP